MVKQITKGLMILSIMFLGLYTNAQEATPASAASLYNKGLEKAKAKEYVEALSLMEQAIAAGEAEDNQKVIDLAKKNGTRAAYGAGSTHGKAKKYDEAIAAFDKGIAFNPAYYVNYSGKAGVLSAQGKKVDAVSAYLKAAEVATAGQKEDKAAQYRDKAVNIVAVLKGKKDWDNTMACAEAFLAGGESGKVHYYMASAMKEKGNTSGALEHVGKALASVEGDDASKAYFLKGECHEKLGQKDQAVAAYKNVTDATYGEMAKYKVGQLSGGK